MPRTLIGLAVLSGLLCFACAKDKRAAAPASHRAKVQATPKPAGAAASAEERTPPPTEADEVRADAARALGAVRACHTRYLSKVDLDAYRRGELGPLSTALPKMGKACLNAVAPLTARLGERLLRHPDLDRALLLALQFRDAYRRLDLYLKRVGAPGAKKNAEMLARYHREALGFSKELALAVGALKDLDPEVRVQAREARRAFLEKVGYLFGNFMENQVRRKRAVYGGVARYLLEGLQKLEAQTAGEPDLQKRIAALHGEIRSAREAYRDFLQASKSKKRRLMKVKKLNHRALAAMR